jgi:hypothetical protein
MIVNKKQAAIIRITSQGKRVEPINLDEAKMLVTQGRAMHHYSRLYEEIPEGEVEKPKRPLPDYQNKVIRPSAINRRRKTSTTKKKNTNTHTK